MMNLVGKSREEIAQATAGSSRAELIDIIYSLATCEPMFKPEEIAARRRLSKKTILQKIRAREIWPIHKPTVNSIRVPLSAIQSWDAKTSLALQ